MTSTLFVIFSKNDKIAYFVNLCSVCDASNLGKERYYNLGQKKKKKKELGTPSIKVIICKSCGELSLLVQFTTCTFEPAFRFVISKQKYNKKYKKILNSQLLTWPKPAKTNKKQSNSQILFHKKSSQQDFVKGT